MKTRMLCVGMIVFFVFSAFSIAEAMTAERVIENMIASYERQMKDIKDFTIITDGYTTYHKRAVIEGRTTYKMRSETEVMGKKYIAVWDGVYHWHEDPMSGRPKKEKMDMCPYAFFENLKAAQVKYAGTDKIDGHKTHILSFKDMDIAGMQKVWVDARDWIIRKMKKDMMTVKMEDFRKVNGMLIAYRTVMTMSVPGAPEMTPEMRKMMESKMRPQVTVVKDVKVNTGLSDELFDGSKIR